MLKVLRANETCREPCALLLGGFDGFHAGHGTLLAAARKTGLPVGATLISGNKPGGNLFTLSEREYLFERAGFAFVAEFPFCDTLKNTPAEEFLKELFARIPAEAVFCGEDFRFGRNALGTHALLKALAPCPVNVLPLFAEGGEKISVSGIKRLLSEGNAAEANRLLYGGFFWQGEVEHGRQVGRTYGFPTLNVRYPEEKFPLREGVYGGYAETPAGTFSAILNVGARPTFGLSEKMTETFLKGFDGDLYGATVRVYPTEFLRPIQKFSSREELEAQLRRDAQRI